jgi:hypothetical protein
MVERAAKRAKTVRVCREEKRDRVKTDGVDTAIQRDAEGKGNGQKNKREFECDQLDERCR